jgi:hypothetical protein
MNSLKLFFILFLSLKLHCKEWNYLFSEVFKTRYVVAAYHMQNCDEIIEIGGYKTPISQFIKNKKITVIDPLSPKFDSPLVKHYQMTLDKYLQTYGKSIPKSKYGIIILGLYLKDISAETWNYLYKLISESTITIIETPIEWSTSVDQFKQILKNTRKKISMQIAFDFSNNNFGELHNSYPPRVKRTMYFLS